MIETSTSAMTGSVGHVGKGTVTVKDLLAAIDSTPPQPRSICWDFCEAHFDVALSVLKEPCYPPVRDHMNSQWQNTPVAFIVSAHLHKHMLELFAAEGDFEFERCIFFNHAEAQRWLLSHAPVRSLAS